MIKILTRRAGCNYGSSLQGFALQQAVQRLGFDCRIVDYDEYVLRWKLRPAFHDMIWRLLSLFAPLSKRALPRRYAFYRDRALQKKRFAEFDRKRLLLTGSRCSSGRDIRKDTRPGDVFLCGSDQIWSPLLYNPVMFLAFCPPGTPKIAYAPSFGVSSLGDKKALIAAHVSDFRRISVREEVGVRMLREAAGRDDIVRMPDPVFLHDRKFWTQLSRDGRSAEGPYILCYFLGKNAVPTNFLKRLSQTTGLPPILIAMHGNPIDFPGEKIAAASPEDFLALIRDAAFVCTDSFHCTAFSILFHKKFFTCKRFANDDKGSQNSRILELLDEYGLSDRLIDDETACDLSEIDCDRIQAHLDAMRKLGEDWLREALESNCSCEAANKK